MTEMKYGLGVKFVDQVAAPQLLCTVLEYEDARVVPVFDLLITANRSSHQRWIIRLSTRWPAWTERRPSTGVKSARWHLTSGFIKPPWKKRYVKVNN